MICIPIVAKETGAAIEMMERALPLAGMVELRIDLMRNPDLKRLLGAPPLPVIVTNRRREEGGGFLGTDAERVALLSEAARLGADYVDIEDGTAPALKEELRRVCAGSRTKRIVSWHDFSGTPSAAFLKTKLAACAAEAPEIVKMVTHADDPADSLRVLELIPLARQSGQAIIAFCMGETGRISRVMAPLLGSAISYAPLELNQSSAPGQVTAGRMREILGVLRDLVPETADHPGLHRPGGMTTEEERSFTR